MERAPDLPLAQRAATLSSHLGALLDLHGQLHTELQLLSEERILYPEVQDALKTASQAILAAVVQLRDRRDDMNAIVERRQIQLIGASQRLQPSPTLSVSRLQRHDQNQASQASRGSQGGIPESEAATQPIVEPDAELAILPFAPAPCAKAKVTSAISAEPEIQSSPGVLGVRTKPLMTIVERSRLFIARAESTSG
eukprot:s1673_g19.t1